MALFFKGDQLQCKIGYIHPALLILNKNPCLTIFVCVEVFVRKSPNHKTADQMFIKWL